MGTGKEMMGLILNTANKDSCIWTVMLEGFHTIINIRKDEFLE